MLRDDVPPPRLALRFSIIWGTLAMLLFVAAAILTEVVLQVHEPTYLPRNLGFASYVAASQTPTTMLVVRYFDLGPKGVALVIEGLPSRSDLYIGPMSESDQCYYTPYRASPGLKKLAGSDDVLGGAYYHLTVMNPKRGELSCVIGPMTFRSSFIDRQMGAAFINIWPKPRGETPMAWTLDLSELTDATNRHFVGGLPGPEPETMRIVATHQTLPLNAYWESKSYTARRNILLIVIGALIALGAATLLEAVRPYVEILAARHKQRHHSARHRSV